MCETAEHAVYFFGQSQFRIVYPGYLVADKKKYRWEEN